MTDLHTHILPCMDDGSTGIRESLEMLRLEKLQNVDEVALTPHFLAGVEDIECFLRRREHSWNQLAPYVTEQMPHISLGAEVQYFEGIRSAGIQKLTISGSNLLLLEMPQCRWSRRMTEDVLWLNRWGDVQVVLAHVERYLSMQQRQTLPELLDAGIQLQVNVSAFSRLPARLQVTGLLKRGYVHYFGSDCHNMTSRPPNWDGLPASVRGWIDAADILSV